MENNPYQTPESDIVQPQGEFKRSIWWKIYFYFIVIISVLGQLLATLEGGDGLAEYLSLTSFVFTTIGLFAFVYNKPIASAKFWFYTLVVTFAYGFIYYGITKVDLQEGLSDLEFYITTIIGFVLMLPNYYALYAISKSDHRVWQTQPNE